MRLVRGTKAMIAVLLFLILLAILAPRFMKEIFLPILLLFGTLAACLIVAILIIGVTG